MEITTHVVFTMDSLPGFPRPERETIPADSQDGLGIPNGALFYGKINRPCGVCSQGTLFQDLYSLGTIPPRLAFGIDEIFPLHYRIIPLIFNRNFLETALA